jgi:hypothetical protein
MNKATTIPQIPKLKSKTSKAKREMKQINNIEIILATSKNLLFDICIVLFNLIIVQTGQRKNRHIGGMRYFRRSKVKT